MTEPFIKFLLFPRRESRLLSADGGKCIFVTTDNWLWMEHARVVTEQDGTRRYLWVGR